MINPQRIQVAPDAPAFDRLVAAAARVGLRVGLTQNVSAVILRRRDKTLELTVRVIGDDIDGAAKIALRHLAGRKP